MKTIILSLLPMLGVVTLAGAETTKPSNNTVSRIDLLSVALTPEKTVSHLEVKEVTLPAGVTAPYHLHPCPTAGIILAGEVAFQIEGHPVQHLRAGDGFFEPANTPIARFDNEGQTPVRMAVIYLRGKDDNETIRYLHK